MNILGYLDVFVARIIAEQKWACIVTFDLAQYSEAQKTPLLANLPGSPLEYLEKALGNEIGVEVILCGGTLLLLFDNEQEANTWFATVPDGSMVDVELYDDKGNYVTDNT